LQEPRGAPESAHIVDDRLHRLSDIRLRYGSITIGTLRLLYGSFAPHCADSEKLGAVLEKPAGPDRNRALSPVVKPLKIPGQEIYQCRRRNALRRADVEARLCPYWAPLACWRLQEARPLKRPSIRLHHMAA
jgi:hypothetical protein